MPKAGKIATAFQDAIGSCQTLPADGAAIALARKYARQIDANADLLGDLGPKLLAALMQLGMTPVSRKEPKGGKSNDVSAPVSALATLRANRAGFAEPA